MSKVGEFYKSNKETIRKWGRRGLGAGAVVVGAAVVAPYAEDLVMERTGLFGAGVLATGALMYTGQERAHALGTRNHKKELSHSVFKWAGVGIAAAGTTVIAIEGINVHFNGKNDQVSQLVAPPNRGGSITTPNFATQAEATEQTCEIRFNFDNTSQESIEDASRLQYAAFEAVSTAASNGSEPAAQLMAGHTHDSFVDGIYGDVTESYLDEWRRELGLPVSESPWDMSMCSRTEFGDNKQNTPAFNDMPELRFAGYAG